MTRRRIRFQFRTACCTLGLLAAMSAPVVADAIDSISGITLRLRASDLLLSDGDPVTAWGALSQSTASKQPLFVASDSQFNGQAVVNFDGVSDHTNGDDLFGSGVNIDARTIYVVDNAETGGGLRGVMSNGSDALNIRLNDNSFYRSPGHGQDGNDFTGAGGTGTFAIDGTNGAPYVVNTPHIVTAVSAANHTYTNLALGNGKPASSGTDPWSGRYFDGQIADVIVFNRTLSAQENFTVLNTLRNTYGIAPGKILGTGTGALLGGDSTDPENDGSDATLAGSNFNATFFTNDIGQANFSNSSTPTGQLEAAFDVFDNKVGGGEAKWCCDGPSTTGDNNIYVGATFAGAGVLDHFTVASSNDTPGRDPLHWAIQGTNDANPDNNSNWTDIFVRDSVTDLFTARDQVIEFINGTDYYTNQNFSSFRYVAYTTGNGDHALGELELFVVPTPAALPAGLILLAAGAVRVRPRRRRSQA